METKLQLLIKHKAMSVLISLLIAIIILGLIWYLLSLLPLPAPFKTVITVLFILIAIIWLIHLAGWFAI